MIREVKVMMIAVVLAGCGGGTNASNAEMVQPSKAEAAAEAASCDPSQRLSCGSDVTRTICTVPRDGGAATCQGRKRGVLVGVGYQCSMPVWGVGCAMGICQTLPADPPWIPVLDAIGTCVASCDPAAVRPCGGTSVCVVDDRGQGTCKAPTTRGVKVGLGYACGGGTASDNLCAEGECQPPQDAIDHHVVGWTGICVKSCDAKQMLSCGNASICVVNPDGKAMCQANADHGPVGLGYQCHLHRPPNCAVGTCTEYPLEPTSPWRHLQLGTCQ